MILNILKNKMSSNCERVLLLNKQIHEVMKTITVQNFLHSTTKQNRLNGLAILVIQHEISDQINLKEINSIPKPVKEEDNDKVDQIKKRVDKLTLENKSLNNDVQATMKKLVRLMKENGTSKELLKFFGCDEAEEIDEVKKQPKINDQKQKQVQRTPKEKPKTAVTKATNEDNEVIHIGRVDLKIGKIISVEKHPDADSLYVEKVDLGNEITKTIVSGLVKHVPLCEMQNRKAVFVYNLKPAKMRGIFSEGMILCAHSPDKVEILTVPDSCLPGDVVTVDGFERKPDDMMNPKKKIFEAVAVDLKTNENMVASYKNAPLSVSGKGFVTSTLPNAYIK